MSVIPWRERACIFAAFLEICTTNPLTGSLYRAKLNSSRDEVNVRGGINYDGSHVGRGGRMEVYLRDLAQMDRKKRNCTLDEMTRVATAHRDNESKVMQVVHAVQSWFVTGRVSR